MYVNHIDNFYQNNNSAAQLWFMKRIKIRYEWNVLKFFRQTHYPGQTSPEALKWKILWPGGGGALRSKT